ncbi:MAG: alpha/beta hydrolase [Syntrophomonadales bacterium]|jgi:carboxylesterase
MLDIDPRAMPLELIGDGANCILIHGLTASPSEMRLLGELLHQRGYSVHAPLLPGHGRTPKHLNQTRWTEWYQEVEALAKKLLQQPVPLVVIGLSMGALLSLELGARVDGIRGIVCINPPLILRDWKSKWARIVRVFRHYIPKYIGDEDREMENRGRFAYDCIPLQAFISMQSLVKVVIKKLEHIDIPVLVVEGAKDELVDPRSYSVLAHRLPPGRMRHLYLTRSPHVATMGDELELLGNEIDGFIKGMLNGI